MKDNNNLIVYCEFEDGNISDVSLELLTKGRSLATQLGVKLEAVVLGDKLEGVEKQIFPYGVDRVDKFEDKKLYPYTSVPHASALINLFKEIKPQVCLMGASSIGRDLGPRVSSCLHSGLTADCTSLEIGDHTDPKTKTEYKNLLYQIRPAFGGNIVAKFLGMLREPAEHLLAKNINTMLRDNGEEIVSNMIGGEVETFLNKPVCKLLEGHEEQLAQAVNTIESIYRSIITEHLPKILQSIDISKIVRERINEMDVNETETLIFQVMSKELKAIVWLGALLGLVMGSINLII